MFYITKELLSLSRRDFLYACKRLDEKPVCIDLHLNPLQIFRVWEKVKPVLNILIQKTAEP